MRWTGTFKPRPVVIMSPFPPAECGRRLERATDRSVANQIIGPIFSGGSGLSLYGKVSPARIRVARLRYFSRNSWQPWFDGVIETAPDGGTILRGTIAPRSQTLPTFLLISAVWAVAIPALIAAGVYNIVSGARQGLPFLLMAGFTAVLITAMVVIAPRQIRSETQRLLGDLSRVLGSTATMES